jgi:hypothetical protein
MKILHNRDNHDKRLFGEASHVVLVPGQQIGIQCAATLVWITLDNEANETRSQKLTNKLHFQFHYSGSTCLCPKNDE